MMRWPGAAVTTTAPLGGVPERVGGHATEPVASDSGAGWLWLVVLALALLIAVKHFGDDRRFSDATYRRARAVPPEWWTGVGLSHVRVSRTAITGRLDMHTEPHRTDELAIADTVSTWVDSDLIPWRDGRELRLVLAAEHMPRD